MYVTPNEHERESLGDDPRGVSSSSRPAVAEGAVIHRRDGSRASMSSAPNVPVVDTTGAGDCFNGVLATRLAMGTDLDAAVRDAVVAASLSVRRAGRTRGHAG